MDIGATACALCYGNNDDHTTEAAQHSDAAGARGFADADSQTGGSPRADGMPSSGTACYACNVGKAAGPGLRGPGPPGAVKRPQHFP
jgi:hypothetical protein